MHWKSGMCYTVHCAALHGTALHDTVQKVQQIAHTKKCKKVSKSGVHCIVATIRTHQEIQCLLYAAFFRFIRYDNKKKSLLYYYDLLTDDIIFLGGWGGGGLDLFSIFT